MNYVYGFLNLKNNNIYIGETNNIKRRYYEHLRYAKKLTNKSFSIHKAINKYGINNFIFKVISTINSKDEALKLEKEWIKILKENNYILYNETNGGELGFTQRKNENNHRSKLKNIQVEEIKFLLLHNKNKSEIAKIFNVSYSVISGISNNTTRQDIQISNDGYKLFAEKYNKENKDLKEIYELEQKLKIAKIAKEKGERLKGKNKPSPHKGKKMSEKQLLNQINNPPRRKITDEQLIEIKKLIANNEKVYEISKKLNISRKIIYNIKSGATWSKKI